MEQLLEFLRSTGFNNIDWRNGIMLVVALGFIFVAVTRDLEPSFGRSPQVEVFADTLRRR